MPARPAPSRKMSESGTGSSGTRCGSRRRSSTRSTCARSSTGTTTAPATSAGSTEKLDYLQWLGVDCIWLLPFYPSPLRDGGYDIADFFSINPDYGTVDDFKVFVDQAHQRGMRVIADLVMNHTTPTIRGSRRAAPIRPARTATGTCGATTTRAGARRASSSSTPSRRTGRGTRCAASTTGIASSRTSPT